MEIKRHRDLTIIDINKDQTLVISCDSSGGIGEKPNDRVKTSPEIVGYYATQVALMELLAYGASPITIVNTLSVEMDDTGNRIIEGIKKAIKPLDIDESSLITGSTEENIPVTATGMGITIIGILHKELWKEPETRPGMIGLVIGLPKVGEEVLQGKNQIMDIEKLIDLKKKDYIHEILPVGSKGILYELDEIARTNGIDFIVDEEIQIDLKKTAGPSTCVIVTMEEENYKTLKDEFSIPVNKLASFIHKKKNP